jgi:hypothetical protein
VALNGALLALLAASIVIVQAADRPEASVEASVRRYATAISNSDLQGALDEVAPDQRARWTDWINGQLGNLYEVRGVAVRAHSLLGPPREVTTVLDVNRFDPGEFYEPTPTVAVEEYAGRWYLAAPLLAD